MDDVAEKLLEECRDFIRIQRIVCAECVYQTDGVLEDAQELIHRICEIVGYHKEELDD